MANWQNFFLQLMGTDSNDAEYPVCESVATWGIFCKKIPFKIMDKVKSPAKRSWNDEDGDDEYIPNGGLRLDAYTMKIEFACKKMSANKFDVAVNDVREKVNTFVNYLKQGHMKMYSSHTKIGRQNVRIESISDNAKWKNEDGEEYLIFEIVFKVNDPVTDIIIENGKLIIAS